jgi:hypothetical protein
VLVNYPQRLWARQLDDEGAGSPLVENHGGVVWILGMKTEKHATGIKTVGGYTELLGGLFYPTPSSGDVPATIPLFINEDASVSFSYVVTGQRWPLQVREMRRGLTNELQRSSVPSRGDGSNVPLYVGYQNELRLLNPGKDAFGRFGFGVQALPGTAFAIDVTGDFGLWQPLLTKTAFGLWQPLITNTSTGLPWKFTDTEVGHTFCRFYRARRVAP